MGLTLLAAHVVSRPLRGLHRYCSNAVILEIADLAYFIFYPATANKADLAERWLDVELWISRDSEPKRGAQQYELILRNAKRVILRADSPETVTLVQRS